MSAVQNVLVSVGILQYISEFYHENPDSYTKECSELDQLRQVRDFSELYVFHLL